MLVAETPLGELGPQEHRKHRSVPTDLECTRTGTALAERQDLDLSSPVLSGNDHQRLGVGPGRDEEEGDGARWSEGGASPLQAREEPMRARWAREPQIARRQYREFSPVRAAKSTRPWEMVGVLPPPLEPRNIVPFVVGGPELARARTEPPRKILECKERERKQETAPVSPSTGTTAAKEVEKSVVGGAGTPGADLARELLEGLRRLGSGQNQAHRPLLYAAARPDKFRGDKNSNIRAWLDAVEMFLEATGQAKTEWAKIVLCYFAEAPLP